MEELMREKEIEHSKKVEKNRLMVADAVKQLSIERKRKQEFQDYVLKTHFQQNAFNQEAFMQTQQMIKQAQLLYQSQERESTNRTNLVR